MKIVYVIWQDAVSVDAWTEDYEIQPQLSEIHTCGILIKENKTTIVVGLNHDISENQYSCFMHIPKKWVVSIKHLKTIR